MLSLHRVRQLSFMIGILLPLAETIRRSARLMDWWMWVDDYLIGGSLIFGAWLSRNQSPVGIRALIAAWGLACGMAYNGMVGHLLNLREPDVSGFSHSTVGIVIALGLALAVWCLISLINFRGSNSQPA